MKRIFIGKKLQVGDRVKCIGETNETNNNENKVYRGAGWEKDFEFVIEEIDENKVVWYGKNENGVYLDSNSLIKIKN